MEQCCICGKKILLADPPFDQLSPGLSEYKICLDCRKERYRIQQGSSLNDIVMGQEYFEKILSSSKLKAVIRDYVSDLLSQSKDILSNPDQLANRASGKENNEGKKHTSSPVLLTTGYDFHGYDIIEYKGIVSGDVVLGTGFLSELDASFSDFFGGQSRVFENKLRTAKEAALDNLRNEVFYKFGANGAIGLSFSYPAFRSNLIGISATATAVVLRKQVYEQV